MKKLTICACSSRTFIQPAQVARLAASARESGWKVEIVPDICELCENKDSRIHDFAQTTIVACHERAVRTLLSYTSEDKCHVLSLRGKMADDVLRELQINTGADGLAEGKESAASNSAEDEILTQIKAMPRKTGTDAWFPCIDKTRCVECGKCFDFCPFGVYTMTDGTVHVANPTHCKNNCPSCARMCPQGAIVFPKYDHSPINGGAVQEEKTAPADIKLLYGDAFRQKLAERRAGVALLKK